MTNETGTRRRLLYALVEYAHQSGTTNPHFHRSEISGRLGLTELEFNVAQKELGDRYCTYVGEHEGDARYRIHVSECLALRDDLEERETQAKRHRELLRLGILVAVLGAVLAAALALWFGSR